MSPERLDSGQFDFEDGRATKESDCYALGMVILEVLTGQPPFPRYTGSTVVGRVADGERPGRPQGREAVWFTDDLWGMLEQCWSPQPTVRPTVEAVLEHLERGSIAWKPLPPTADDFGQTLSYPASNAMQEIPDTTEEAITLIAKGTLDPKRAPQLLNKTFDAPDYLAVLRNYPEAQQYMDGLYKVYFFCFCK